MQSREGFSGLTGREDASRGGQAGNIGALSVIVRRNAPGPASLSGLYPWIRRTWPCPALWDDGLGGTESARHVAHPAVIDPLTPTILHASDTSKDGYKYSFRPG